MGDGSHHTASNDGGVEATSSSAQSAPARSLIFQYQQIRPPKVSVVVRMSVLRLIGGCGAPSRYRMMSHVPLT